MPAVQGRSDATINRHGVRMGTSEIYAAVESLPDVVDSVVLDLQSPQQDSRLVLFVVPRGGVAFDKTLLGKIRDAIRTNLSPRFLPDEIIHAPEIPRTLSGKKLEVPMKRLFLGHDPDAVISREVMANPRVVDWYIARAAGEAERPATLSR